MNATELVSLASALAAAILAFIPVYQKWREVRRDQDAADRDKGVTRPSPFRAEVRQTVTAVSSDRQSLALVVLSLLILGGLVHNAWRGQAYGRIIDSHFQEFVKVRDLVEQRYGETRAQRSQMLDILHRIEAEVKKLDVKK